MIRVTKKRKNPHLNNIEDFIKSNSSKFEYLDRGREAKVFYFKLNKSLVLNTEVLKSGEYALKIYDDKFSANDDGELSINQISKLKLLSKYGLIPKIFVITKKYTISKFIHGISYDKFERDIPEINNRVRDLIKIWNKLGFEHDDINLTNILVSDNLKSVYLIDPYIEN